MAAARLNSKSPTIRRILKEAAEFSNSPSADYTASPLESDFFEWHFTIRGPPNSAFAQGLYHGRIVLPPTYPLRPPMFRFTTPSGRFEPNREICLSISGHHEETWQPAWGVRTAIVALRSFMETDARGQIGGLNTGDDVRRELAARSRAWTCPACARSNADIIREVEERCRELDAESGGSQPRREVEVPAELKLAFKDEMEKEKAEAEAAKGAAPAAPAAEEGGRTSTADDAETAQLAEGFVQTAARPADASSAAHAAQSVPAPTRTVPTSASASAARARTRPQRRVDPTAGAPVWIDYAIISLVVILVAMLLKILTGR